jgi:hypothetical protein
MIYLYVVNNTVEPHANKEFAENVLKLGEPIAVLTQKEWENYEGLARMIDGELFFGKTQEEKNADIAEEARSKRDRLIESVRWRIERHNDEVELNRTPTEELRPLLDYVQALRDIPQQSGFPENVIFPEEI